MFYSIYYLLLYYINFNDIVLHLLYYCIIYKYYNNVVNTFFFNIRPVKSGIRMKKTLASRWSVTKTSEVYTKG